MKRLFNDDITQSIAATVQDVLEGKPAVKKEAEEFKPHMMYDPNTGKGYKAEKPEDHERMAKLGYVHEKPKNVNEVEEPRAKGEKEFKKLHTIKKSGEKEDGTVVKESTITLDEAKIDVDYIGDKDLTKKLEKKFKIKIKNTGNTTADVSGTNANLIKFLKSDAYLMDNDEIEELFPELMESVEEESEKQAAYKKVFNAGLKKFGVSGIGEMDDEKKKEFFNWVDKNYEAKAEELDKKGEEEVDELTDKQKKLPPALQKAIKAKEKEEVKEAVISTPFSSDEMKNVGGDKAAKKMGIKVKVQRGQGDGMYGDDNGIFTGSEQALVKYFKDYMGFEGKNFKELKKEFHR